VPNPIREVISPVEVELATDDHVQGCRGPRLCRTVEAVERDSTAMFSPEQGAEPWKRMLADVIARDVETAELICASSEAHPQVDIQARVGSDHGRLVVRLTLDGAAVRGDHSDVA
jgi:hypothetical protein